MTNPFLKKKSRERSSGSTGNPFTAKAKRSTASKASKGSKVTSLVRPWIGRTGRVTPRKWRWIEVGQDVRVSWRYDPAYGSGRASFVGTVMHVDSWLFLVNSHGVRCELPLFMVEDVEER